MSSHPRSLETKIRLAEQNLARLQASAAWEVNKDELKRRITATKDLIKRLKSEAAGDPA
jgi:hypothetical protein